MHIFAVAPFVGAWIEIGTRAAFLLLILSHPLWVRGLKSLSNNTSVPLADVAPFVGAWIEILIGCPFSSSGPRRTLCGCVD